MGCHVPTAYSMQAADSATVSNLFTVVNLLTLVPDLLTGATQII